jgi:hypothetical protein
MKIGLDFGGVITKLRDSRPQTDTLLDRADGIEIAHEGALDGIKTLVAQTGGSVWIVSKAGLGMQERTRNWLESVDFFSHTGMARENLRFCLERSGKKAICTSLDITHFVDDRIHIMQILRQVVPHLFLFGAEESRHLCPPWATFVTSWSDLLTKALTSPNP